MAAETRPTARNGNPPLGILACAGVLPIEIAESAIASGRNVHVVAIDGFASPDVQRFSHEHVNLGQVGRMLSSLRRHGCRDLVIAGALQRPNLWRLKFDFGLIKGLPTLLSLTKGGDDSVLRRIVRFFEAQGFVVKGVPDVAPHLLAPEGLLGTTSYSDAEATLITLGAELIATLGSFDVGQAVVVGPKGVVAVEGVRGTDAMLRDIGPGGIGDGLAQGGVLVKLPKPGQEMRVDLPTIGPQTAVNARASGLAGIAVAAGQTVVLGRRELVAAADQAGLFLVGTQPTRRIAAQHQPDATPDVTPLAVAGRRAPTPADRRDIGVGRRIVPVLRVRNAGRAVVIAREHVLAVAGALPIDRVIEGLGRGSLWGRRALRGRIGVLVLDIAGSAPGEADLDAMPGPEIFRAVMASGLAGIACLGAPLPKDRRNDIVAWANEAKVFLMTDEPPAI